MEQDNLFGRKLPKLGFGCMRLPEGQDGEYIESECQEMFDYAMAHGINYFDSAWHYVESQLMIGKCLEKYPRESYILVGKLCFYDGTLESIKAAEQAFAKELSDARTDYMDLELIHALGNPGSLERVDALNVWGFMRKLKKMGKVKHIGISFHSYPENLEKILKNHPEIEVVQIQANYYDHNTDGAKAVGGSYETYEICRKYNKPIIIMEPVKGGTLSTIAEHPEVRKMLKKADPSRSPSAWALQYAASLDGVLTVLSGMSTIEQMKENCEILGEKFIPLNEEEKDMLAEVAKLVESKKPVGCTGCHYCTDKGCPAGIKIPEVLACLNMLNQFNNPRMTRMKYYPAIEESSPRDCISCGTCEGECPQKLPIMKLIREADERLYIGNDIDLWANH
ncbi:MAG: aldo/keto reductase [Hespellia sp.]|nr:aldo/keto reductase [Hespellia sp.]